MKSSSILMEMAPSLDCAYRDGLFTHLALLNREKRRVNLTKLWSPQSAASQWPPACGGKNLLSLYDFKSVDYGENMVWEDQLSPRTRFHLNRWS